MQTPVRFAMVAVLLLLSACGLFGGPAQTAGQTAPTTAVFGYAVADEPQAALAARQILNQGGNAADAAAAAGFALTVTLPSRAGLGGGGACMIRMPDAGGTMQPASALIFPAGAPAGSGGSRPAAIPTMARGLLALQARYGTLNAASDIVPAERLAGGVPVSPALAADLQVVGSALLADPAAAAIYGRADGTVLQAGDTLVLPDLSATLEVLRTQGVPGFYQGRFATSFVQSADAAGAGLTAQDMNAGLPQYLPPVTAAAGSVQITSLPVAPPSTAILPASTGFAVLDKNGGSVACAVSMNNLFGTGRIAGGTGILLAASPRAVPAPLLAAALAYNGTAFRAAVTGTGQAGAATAVRQAMAGALQNHLQPVAEPGRANVISCPGLVPGGEASCTAQADPRMNGLALGGR